jgi:hypothetical protein
VDSTADRTLDSNVVVVGLERDLAAAFLRSPVVHEVLDPHLVGHERHAKLVAEDGEADLYSSNLARGFLVSHATGVGVWDLVIEAARRAGMAIFLPDRGTCIPDEAMRDALPPYAPQPVVVVHRGADLVEAMGASAPAAPVAARAAA